MRRRKRPSRRESNDSADADADERRRSNRRSADDRRHAGDAALGTAVTPPSLDAGGLGPDPLWEVDEQLEQEPARDDSGVRAQPHQPNSDAGTGPHLQRSKQGSTSHFDQSGDDSVGPTVGVDFPDRQLQKKFKHAPDFGVSGNWNPTNRRAFERALKTHVASGATRRIEGTYRGKDVIHYYDESTRNDVLVTPDGTFLSAWTLNEDQERHLLESGDL